MVTKSELDAEKGSRASGGAAGCRLAFVFVLYIEPMRVPACVCSD